MTKIDDLIWDYEKKILTLKKRFYYISAALEELRKVTAGNPFQIKNDLVWQMLLDSFSMLVIDLASLYRGMAEQGGFFGQLKLHCSKLRRKSHKQITAPEPVIVQDPSVPSDPKYDAQVRREIQEHFQRTAAQNIEDKLYLLFPRLKDDPEAAANHADVDALKEDLMKRAEIVLHDRDTIRAHRFQGGEKTTIPGISLKQVEEHFEYLEEFMNALRNVSIGSTMMYDDMNQANVKATAENIIDIIVMGGINQIFNKFDIPAAIHPQNPKFYYLFREKFYKTDPSPFGKKAKVETNE